MHEVPYPEIFKIKTERQERIDGIRLDMHGAVPHVGPISPGCTGCLSPKRGSGIFFGRECPCSCSFCYYELGRPEETEEEQLARVREYVEMFREYPPENVSFTSEGETLLHLDKMNMVAQELNRLERQHGISIHRHVYTNGVYADRETLEFLAEMGVDEIRFHLSATDFHPLIIEHMRDAKKIGFKVTVEEPAWPPLRSKLFELLPTFHDIGLSHLNLIEMELTSDNFNRTEKLYPQGIYYRDFLYHLYDEGLVYDIMEEVIKNNYCFSVLDCGSIIERYRGNHYMYNFFDYSLLDNITLPFEPNQPNQHWYTPR